jgi:hypothetical protein
VGFQIVGETRPRRRELRAGDSDPRMTARYAHVVDMAKKNPALFIPEQE